MTPTLTEDERRAPRECPADDVPLLKTVNHEDTKSTKKSILFLSATSQALIPPAFLFDMLVA